jgi:hypothetical protein
VKRKEGKKVKRCGIGSGLDRINRHYLSVMPAIGVVNLRHGPPCPYKVLVDATKRKS